MLTRKMKDSGIEWIGKIPENWEVKKVKYMFRIVNGNGFPENLQGEKEGDYPFYKNSDINKLGIYINKSNNYISKNTATINKFTVIPSKSILIGKIGEALKRNHRKINLSECMIDNNMMALVPKENELFSYYLLTTIDMFWFDNNGTIPSINSNKLRNFKIPYVNKTLQKNIVEILNKKTRKIDKLISSTQQSIEELKKYKQSLITEAVTKGLDPNVEMKDSGIEWIGEIPSDWIIKKTRYFLMETSIKNHPDEEVLSLYRDYGVVPKNSRDDNHNVTSANTSNYKFVRKNDVVINKMKAWQGSIAISEYKGIVSPAYYTFEVTDKEIEFKFLHYALRNNLYLDEYMRLSAGLRVGQWDLNKNEFKNILYPFPNSISEQLQIVSYLDEQTSRIDKLIADKTKVIEELEDYKKSLIYEYVTGKKEV